MKTLRFTAIIVISILTLVSCGGGISKQPANAEGFGAIEKEIKNKFGNDAYYTDLSIMYMDGIGNTVSTTVTDSPESLKMGEWDLSQDSWVQSSEVTLELPEGTKATDFMFQLNETISLSKLGELVEKSMKQLTDEKGIENPTLSIAAVKFPNNGDMEKAQYSITLQPENGGTSFSFYYELNGDFIEMDY